jgi:CRISPR/Cas system CSM-associated protein Csm3 (group 7 of RAMP superfamily)
MTPTYGPFRLEINGLLHLQSSLRIGSPDQLDLATDMPVLRLGGKPYLPGSSLRGVLRAHLAREHSLLGCNQDTLQSLFGHAGPWREDDAQTCRGRLRIFDSFPKDLPAEFEIRDHVRISPETGAAEERAKFDRENIPLTTSWVSPLRIIYEGEKADDEELILLGEALRALENAELTFGSNSSIGFGRLKLEQRTVIVLDRSSAAGLLAFLRSRLPAPVTVPPTQFEFPKPKPPIAGAAQNAPWNSLTFEVQLRGGPVLIKAPKPPVKDKAKPDFTFVTKVGSHQPYIPGSGLRGILRHRAELICASQHVGSSLVSTLFGSAKDDGSGSRGLLKFDDGSVSSIASVKSDHVALDRITQAAADGKKFDDEALDSPCITFQIHISFCESSEHLASVALLLFLIRDLLAQPCPIAIGSQSSRGYGTIQSANLQTLRGSFHGGLGAKVAHHATPELRPGRTAFHGPGGAIFPLLCAEFNPAWQHVRGREVVA